MITLFFPVRFAVSSPSAVRVELCSTSPLRCERGLRPSCLSKVGGLR